MDAAASPAAPADASARPSGDDAADVAAASPRASPGPPSSSDASDGRVVAEIESETPTVEEDRLRVRLKMLDEHVFEVDATPSTTIAAFREQVARVTQVPPPRQRLIYRGAFPCIAALLSR